MDLHDTNCVKRNNKTENFPNMLPRIKEYLYSIINLPILLHKGFKYNNICILQ
jgi:hypothetical protein